jgi:hypothetical protein
VGTIFYELLKLLDDSGKIFEPLAHIQAGKLFIDNADYFGEKAIVAADNQYRNAVESHYIARKTSLPDKIICDQYRQFLKAQRFLGKIDNKAFWAGQNFLTRRCEHTDKKFYKADKK